MRLHAPPANKLTNGQCGLHGGLGSSSCYWLLLLLPVLLFLLLFLPVLLPLLPCVPLVLQSVLVKPAVCAVLLRVDLHLLLQMAVVQCQLNPVELDGLVEQIGWGVLEAAGEAMLPQETSKCSNRQHSIRRQQQLATAATARGSDE